VSVKESDDTDDVAVMTLTVLLVYCTVHVYVEIPLAPPVNDVERSVHVVAALAALRIWQTLVVPAVCAGSDRLNDATTPGSCVMVTVCPPIVTVPVRVAPAFCAAVMTTVPTPVPVAPLVMVRNDELLAAVHPQFETVDTVIDTVPPPLLAFALVGPTETAQPAGATSVCAAWTKLTLVPLTVMLAARSVPVFAAML
jgi:hypothetical protein